MNLEEWKQCTGPCKEVKHVDDFPKDKTKRSGRKPWCSLCHASAQQDRRKQNSGHWHAAIQENYRVRTQYGRMDEVVTPAEREELFALAENKCVKCGGEEMLETDHVVPLVMGGKHHISNLQVLCHGCNTSKGTGEGDYRDNVRKIT